MQILKTLKILPIGNKTMLRDSRILSVVEKWSKEVASGSGHSTEVTTATSAESAETAGDAEQEQELEGSDTETREANNGTELTDGAEAKQPDVGPDIADQSSVSKTI